MRMRVLRFALAGVLVLLYLAVLFLVLHPKVSKEYRTYFIEQTSSEWKPARYAATPEQGILLGKNGLPDFVDYIYGFSSRESWGRWTDARRNATAGLVLRDGLTGQVCVLMKAQPANSQSGKLIRIKFGDQEQKIALSSRGFSEYALDFFEKKPADKLEFQFYAAVPPENVFDRTNSDVRRLGLALMYIRFIPRSCRSVQEGLAKAVLEVSGESEHQGQRR